MESEWSSILFQIVGAVGAVVVGVIGIVGTFYVKRLETKLKMKTLNDEIRQMVDWSKNSNTFKLMAKEEQLTTLVQQLRIFADENGIAITETKLLSMIENMMNYPLKLEGQLLKLKEMNK